jgi:glucosylceramidase
MLNLPVSILSQCQTIIGFGGAFTEAAAINYANLSSDLQDALMEMYFGPTGIGYRYASCLCGVNAYAYTYQWSLVLHVYRLGRIHINSCDFSDESYTYDPIKNDFNVSRCRCRCFHELQSDL